LDKLVNSDFKSHINFKMIKKKRGFLALLNLIILYLF
jgi:hypothetical protein